MVLWGDAMGRCYGGVLWVVLWGGAMGWCYGEVLWGDAMRRCPLTIFRHLQCAIRDLGGPSGIPGLRAILRDPRFEGDPCGIQASPGSKHPL